VSSTLVYHFFKAASLDTCLRIHLVQILTYLHKREHTFLLIEILLLTITRSRGSIAVNEKINVVIPR